MPSIPAGSETPPASPAASPPAAPAPPTATWSSPEDGATVTKTKLALAAKAGVGTPPAGVAFTVAWGSKPAKAACKAKGQPDGTWSCTADLAKLGAPPGDLKLGLDVIDAAGNHGPVPAAARGVTYAPASAKSWTWRTVGKQRLSAAQVIAPSSRRLVGVVPATWFDIPPCSDITVGAQKFGGLTLSLYDTRTGKLTETRPTSRVNEGASVVALEDGRFLVVGAAVRWNDTSSARLPAAEIYNPVTKRWKRTSAPSAAGYQSVVVLDGDHVALIGGSRGTADDAGIDRVEVMTVSNGKIKTIAHLPARVRDSVAVRLGDGRILVVPGGDGVKAAYVVNPDSGVVKTLKAPVAGTWWSEAWRLPDGGAVVTAIIPNGKHGVLATTTVSRDGKTWDNVQRVPLGWDAWVVGHDANGQAILAGGIRMTEDCMKMTYTARALAVDPRNGDVTNLPDLPFKGTVAWITLLPDGRVAAGPSLSEKPRGVVVLGPP